MENPSHHQEVSPGLSWVVLAGPFPPGLFHTSGTGGCLYLTTAVSCAVALGRSHLPYRPFALKRRTAMKTRETRRRLPKTIQGMRSVSSRDSLSFTLTGTEDSGNPVQAGKEMDVSPFNTFLCLFTFVKRPHLPFHPFPPPVFYSNLPSHRLLNASSMVSAL